MVESSETATATTTEEWFTHAALALRFGQRVPPDLRQQLLEDAHRQTAATGLSPWVVYGSPNQYAQLMADKHLKRPNTFGFDLDGLYPWTLRKSFSACLAAVLTGVMLLSSWQHGPLAPVQLSGRMLTLTGATLLFLMAVQLDRLASFDGRPATRVASWTLGFFAIVGYVGLHQNAEAANSQWHFPIPTLALIPVIVLLALLCWRLPYWAPTNGGRELLPQDWYRRVALIMHATYGQSRVRAAEVAARARAQALTAGKHPADLFGDTADYAVRISRTLPSAVDTEDSPGEVVL